MDEVRPAGADPSVEAGSDLPGYRPVSGRAVVAAAVGCVSALALVSPVFWVVPLLGVAVAVHALRDISRSGMSQAGGLAAVAGLALSVGFGAQAVSAAFTARWLAAARAETAVGAWLEAVCAGRANEARSMSGPGVDLDAAATATCCGADHSPPRCVGAGRTAGAWRVLVARGECQLGLEIEPTIDTSGGRTAERWTVTSLVRPPARSGK